MIVPMQKVVIIGPPSKGMAIVRRLGALGVVHLEPVRSSHKDGTNDALEAARQAMKLLDEGQVPASSVDVERAIQQTNAAHVRREQAQTELLELQCEAERIAPLGEFDPGAFAELASGGIHSQLFTCTRGVLPEIRAMHLPFAEVGHAGKTRYVVLFRMPTKGLPSGLVPVALPECSLSQIQARIADRVAEIANADAELAELSASRPEIVAEIASMEDEEACLGVVDSMADQAPFVTCCGFCPEDQVVAVRAAIGELGGGLLAVPPGDCDEPPTLLKNAKLAASAEPIYRLIDTVPGYRE
ncbi:MAG: vacuolar-type H+-ATPase subunit I/STV1, partial [Rhodothermales bacterium]